jgi:nitroimidazol reductase NimA-like FMN-containing flavoprotein (pyridoxamine 5'-phosphate oxidase superfamily)
MNKEEFALTERSRVRRLAKRGKYDRETIYKILDEASLCHVSFCLEDQPFIIPTLFARVGDSIYLHGSHISRMLRTLGEGVSLSLAVTLTDGLVLARSAFHHSMNYRSAVVFGRGTLVDDENEKISALQAISEQLVPGRWDDCRPPNAKELSVTAVVRIEIEEASAKIREGMPVDDREDYALPVWAGIVPVRQSYGEPVSDEVLPEAIDVPAYLREII